MTTDYRSKSVAFRGLAESLDPNARKQYHLMQNHPARNHLHLGPLWSSIYKEHKKTSVNIPVARKRATITILAIMNLISYNIDPTFTFIKLEN